MSLRTVFQNDFSKSLIIHAALTQPEHLVLVRWMGLETQWKTSWKHGRVWKPVFETISNTDANFLHLHIDKATKTRGDKQLYLTTHFTKQTLNLNYLLLTLNITEQNRKGHSFSKFKFSLNDGDLVFWFTFNLAVHFRPKMALTLAILSD